MNADVTWTLADWVIWLIVMSAAIGFFIWLEILNQRYERLSPEEKRRAGRESW